MKRKYNQGFVGILSLLIVVAAGAFAFWYMYLKENINTERRPGIQTGLEAVHDAEALKNTIEINYRQTTGE